jgi:hypothetical protein
MDSFNWEGMITFPWYMDVQIRKDGSVLKQHGKLKLVANYNKTTQNEKSWKTSEEDIEAILSLWIYHFKDEKQRELRDWKAGSKPSPFNPELIRTPFRRVLGPATDVLKADLSWWAGEGVVQAIEEFTWVTKDNPLSLGYGHQRRFPDQRFYRKDVLTRDRRERSWCFNCLLGDGYKHLTGAIPRSTPFLGFHVRLGPFSYIVGGLEQLGRNQTDETTYLLTRKKKFFQMRQC